MKVGCKNVRCNWRGASLWLSRGVNPFDKTEEITGCPECHGINTCEQVCDVDECQEFASCGWISPEGYQHTCRPHMAPKFPVTWCSRCGQEFGPGDHGFSHCENHGERSDPAQPAPDPPAAPAGPEKRA